jgi:thiol:disulfide interchange protein DsbC
LNSIMRRILPVACLALLSLPALAGEAEIRKGLASVLRDEGKVVSIQKTPYPNLYEVVLSSGEIAYADGTGSFLIGGGQLIDVKNRRNVTAERERVLNRVNLADLPLSQAIKQVRGTGKRTLITFEDPNCGFCKKLAKDAKDLKDTTIYTFLIPILSPDSADKARNIWCSSDKAKAWNDWMIEGKAPADAQCDTPLQKNSALAQKYHITGTPTLFFADGNRNGGYMPLADLDKAITDGELVHGKSAQ